MVLGSCRADRAAADYFLRAAIDVACGSQHRRSAGSIMARQVGVALARRVYGKTPRRLSRGTSIETAISGGDFLVWKIG
jgi:hypothetical protein